MLQWNPAALGAVCVIPAAVADKHLQLASPLQLRVLLWFAANGAAPNLAACAATLHKPLAAIEEAVQYWLTAGVLLTDGEMSAPPVTDTAFSSAPPTSAASPESSPAPPVRPTKPQRRDVLQQQKNDPAFVSLLHDVETRLGKPLSGGGMETLLYLYDTLAISSEVLLLAVAYATARGKRSISYIEQVAIHWQEEGITTVAAAEQHLALLEQMDAAANKVRALAGIARELDYRQRGMARTWLYIWNFSEDVIKVALDYAIANGKPPIAYANTILGNWHDTGVTDPAAAAETLARPGGMRSKKKSRAQTEKSSLQLDQYEQLLEDYVPTLPHKRKKEG